MCIILSGSHELCVGNIHTFTALLITVIFCVTRTSYACRGMGEISVCNDLMRSELYVNPLINHLVY